jgi:type IV pilus assembly protein PilX
MCNKKENGYILITALLMLLVLTVIGFAAIGTSSIENLLSGNIRLRETNISKADAGAEISTAVIERTVRMQDTRWFASIITDPALSTELRSFSFDSDANTDVAFTVAGQNVSVDIDKMYMTRIGGTAIEFASGYEGTGKSGGSAFYTYYRINSSGVDSISSGATVGAIYRYLQN